MAFSWFPFKSPIELLKQASNKNTILFGSMLTGSSKWVVVVGGVDVNGGTIYVKMTMTYKGSYTRVKAYILHEGVKGVDVCAHTRDPAVRATFEKEHNDAQTLKEKRSNIGISSNTHLAASSKRKIIHETRKRRAIQFKKRYENLQLQVKMVDC
jgi:ribosomal protein L31